MKHLLTFVLIIVIVCNMAHAQGIADPLSYHGLQNFNPMNVRSHAMGGSAVAVGTGISSMFSNPATLTNLQSIEFSIGGNWQNINYEQSQRWNPNRFYADLSLMFENRFDGIKDPEIIRDSTDFLHKPFDKLKPEWNKNTSAVRPSVIAGGIPFSLMGVKIGAGIGYAEMINLNHYYQNNNAMSPYLGNYRPYPLPVVTQGDTLFVEWYQFIRQRKGSIYGIVPAIAVNPLDGISIGLSVAVLTGSSDDQQLRNDRGHLRFLYNSYLLDSISSRSFTNGTSKYSGLIPTIGCLINQDYYSLGISLRPPATITRKWDQKIESEIGITKSTLSTNGTDKLKMPWFYTLGIAFYPSEKINIGIDYAVQPYAEVKYLSEQNNEIFPWVSSKAFRVGIEYKYKKWLNLRAGAREEIQAFTPAGEGLIGDPASGAVYTAGFGVQFENIIIDGSYEYGTLRYNDLWQSNVNTNKVLSHNLMLEVCYKLFN
jgi:long-subunit fatty acid transport protein